MLTKIINPFYFRLLSRFSLNRKVHVDDAARLIILHEGDTPTLAYFHTAFEAVYPNLPTLYIDLGEKPKNIQFLNKDIVVIVRYLNNAWRDQLQYNRRRLAGLIYFMDDDLLDIRSMSGLPTGYARRLKHKALRFRPWIERYCSEFWVGTQALADKYRDMKPCVLHPVPVLSSLPSSDGPIRIAYHGSASHMDEAMWLRNVIEKIVRKTENIHVELFGDSAVSRAYRDLPHVSIMHAMPWAAYLSYTSTCPVDIFLVPLTANSFNKGRSYTKFFDAARVGAAGLYSSVTPYKEFVRDGIDGILLNNEVEIWAEAILNLMENSHLRKTLADNSRARSHNLRVIENKIIDSYDGN